MVQLYEELLLAREEETLVHQALASSQSDRVPGAQVSAHTTKFLHGFLIWCSLKISILIKIKDANLTGYSLISGRIWLAGQSINWSPRDNGITKFRALCWVHLFSFGWLTPLFFCCIKLDSREWAAFNICSISLGHPILLCPGNKNALPFSSIGYDIVFAQSFWFY